MTLPNQLTTLRILLTPLFVWLILSDSSTMRLWGIGVFTLASLTDLYDGYHARKYGETTRWGAFMDPLADKILITAAFLVFVLNGIVELWMVIVVFLRDVLVTVLRLYAELKDKPVITSRSAKLKTLMQNLLAYLLLLLMLLSERSVFDESIAATAAEWLHAPQIRLLMLGLTIYTVYTGIAYLVENWPLLRAAYLSNRSSVKA
ncbi:MAG: CDP-diacylglycerol--glycerol-3-phosphate 3-phosphatidyltransferase [Chloroherpetonaceae bacterium]|nr:CDP-diacylglycerol--glycerol-3-phosphate 3-phosphatidyltransferase [Chloroherpetonaceae bacterium]